MVVSLGFGLIAAIGISQVMGTGTGSNKPEIQMGPVLVATIDLKHGTELTEENIKIENWPLDIIPEEACRSFEDISNKSITTRLSKSLPILRTDIVKSSDIGKVSIPAGFRVVAIKVQDDDTFSGLLQPGDHVDVIGVIQVRPEGAQETRTVSETFLKNIEVFSIGSNLSKGPRDGGSTSTIVGVLVNERQSEQIVLIQKVAQLKLVLRGEDAATEESGLDQEKFDSVFGNVTAENHGTKTIVGHENPQDSHTMRIYSGQSYESVKFVGDERVTPIENQTPALLEESDDHNDRNNSDEIDSGLEEDQYPGE